MPIPIVILTGRAGSGKDTVANFMAKDHGAVAIAQADPLKRLGSFVFGFTDEQLWGPSECRNAIDKRGYDVHYWENRVEDYFDFSWSGGGSVETLAWLEDVGLAGSEKALQNWLKNVVEYSRKSGLTPRHVLQTLGTEFGRRLKPTVWVDYAQNMASKILAEGCGYDRTRGAVLATRRPSFVVITDGRFANEVLATKLKGGVAIRIDPGTYTDALQGAAGQHLSEVEQSSIPEHWFDAVVVNDKKLGLMHCRMMTDQLVEKCILRNPERIY